MLTFIQTHAMGGDCTAPYDVKLDKPYTVGEFIKEVLTARSNEWGEFVVRCKGSDYFNRKARNEYRYGKMEGLISDRIASLPISEVKASGGWSRMDYNLMVD